MWHFNFYHLPIWWHITFFSLSWMSRLMEINQHRILGIKRFHNHNARTHFNVTSQFNLKWRLFAYLTSYESLNDLFNARKQKKINSAFFMRFSSFFLLHQLLTHSLLHVRCFFRPKVTGIHSINIFFSGESIASSAILP